MRKPICTTMLVSGMLLSCGSVLRAQVFVVGEKTATADAVTEFHPTRVTLPDQPLDERGRLDLIRNLESEQGFAHRELPLGAGLTLLANGKLNPGAEEYRRMLYEKGVSATPGERVEISKLEFRADRLVIDFNGGPYAKHRFLSHVSLNGMQMAQQGPIATGCRVTLVFEGGLPNVTAAEVKALLDPLVDFRAKSSAEAYADTLSPKVREAVEAHEVLVGMNRRMVLAALGEPKTKHREHTDGEGSNFYEEWIYGEPPQAIQFVRFVQDHVVRLEIAALGKPLVIHERNEMGAAPAPALEARTILNGDVHNHTSDGRNGTPPPTLHKPGDPDEGVGTAGGMGKVTVPKDGSQNLAAVAGH